MVDVPVVWGTGQMDEQDIAARKLVEFARPYLLRDDLAGLARDLDGSWSADCLALFLESHDAETIQVVTIALGLVGDMSACAPLLKLLQRDDPRLISLAEDALWSIWFRAAGPVAQGVLTRIAPLIHEKESDNVIPLLTSLIKTFPNFAEAYHQRSQAYSLLGRYQAALRDAKRAIELNPTHFGAMANMANSLVALGRYDEALGHYEAVLRLHPHMPDIDQAIDQLSKMLRTGGTQRTSLSLVTDQD